MLLGRAVVSMASSPSLAPVAAAAFLTGGAAAAVVTEVPQGDETAQLIFSITPLPSSVSFLGVVEVLVLLV